MSLGALGSGKKRWLVFTDLDGTLLEHKTYRFDAARPALRFLKERDIPLIICTSKTRAEVEKLRIELDQNHPFIPENGGGIFIPRGYFSFSFRHNREDERYLIIEFGTPYSELRAALSRMKKLYPGKIKGFGDLSAAEVARVCGFSLAEARLAKKRGYDEPFILEDSALEPQVEKQARALGFDVTRGSRFYHLLGDNDKGKAVSRLTAIYRQSGDTFITVGLGDSLNDLPMLRAVDRPALVQKPDGNYDPGVKLPGLFFAPGPGPEGFRVSVLRLVGQQT
jgi:mannosyl-3-phosphoglycerate phosphatase